MIALVSNCHDRDSKSKTEKKVIVRCHAATAEQAHRLSTAVDAFLAELVRQELSRERQL